MDSDEDFFRKPQVFESSQTGQVSVEWENDMEPEEEVPWLMELPKVQAEITKVLVFDGMMPEPELETQNSSGETEGKYSLTESNNEDEFDEEQTMETTAETEVEEMQEHNMDASPETSINTEEDVKDCSQLQLQNEANMYGVLPELSIFENSFKTNNVLAVLKQDIEIYGTIVLTLLCGRIIINGYKPRRNVPLTIFSPKGFNWVVISPMSNKKPIKAKIESSSNWDELNESFSRGQLDNIVANYDGQRDAIVLLQRNSGSQNILNIFGKHMAENVFPLVNASNRPHYASEYILNCLVQSADARQALQVPTVWTKLAMEPSSRWMVAGGKGVGKSTLLRYMLNRHLERFERMLFIDLDIGQPELFLPQTVSCTVVDAPLLGAGFFLNRQPDRAYAVGHVNVVMCAEQYIRAVRQLLVHCKANKSYAEMPWVINTMGYNKGFGLELMALLVDCVQPTDVVQISSHKAVNNFDTSLDRVSLSKVRPIIYTADEFKLSGELSNYTLHNLRSALPQLQPDERRWRMSAKDVRYANLLARLSSALHGNAKYLTDCQPVRVDLDALEFVHLISKEYEREELIAGMEANLVYLCKRGMDDQPKECLGIGKL